MTDNEVALEAINAATFVQSVFLTVIFGVFLWWYRGEYFRTYYRLIVAIAVYHFGASLAWGWRWVVRAYYQGKTGDAAEFILDLPIPLIAAIIMTVGLMCKIRVLTHEGFGNAVWLVSLFCSVALALYVALS